MAQIQHHCLPPPKPTQVYVTVSAMTGGFITLPEKFFVLPNDPDAKHTVPSLVFFIDHPGILDDNTGRQTPARLLFDLGLRSRVDKYTPAQQAHLVTREPFTLETSISEKLAESGVNPRSDVDYIILSHVHYDHHGDPEDFPGSIFLVGDGSLDILRQGLPGLGSHQHFQSGILPEDRTVELGPFRRQNELVTLPLKSGGHIRSTWERLGPFPHALDILKDGSIYVVDSPGHLPGHINLLCRTGKCGWIYLGGDSCHDLRLLTGEKAIGKWENEEGHTLCIHLDVEAAEKTIEQIAALQNVAEHNGQHVEVIMAHDANWLKNHHGQLFPAIIRL